MTGPADRTLPPPPAGREGWPWEVQVTAADVGLSWPRITIVTPSFNQAAFIEETIRSVLLQGYPNLEYIVIDGGSRDGTVEVIRKYEPWLSYWVSEPDRGQTHAINKGLARATGELFNFINSDDLLLPHSLFAIAAAHAEHPRSLIAGDVLFLHEGKVVQRMGQSGLQFRPYLERWWTLEWSQMGIFFPMELVRDLGPLREDMHFTFDYEYIARCLERTDAVTLNKPVAVFRAHEASKTGREGFYFSLERLPVLRTWQARYPDWDWKPAERVLAADLLHSGLYRILHRRPEAWRFVREAMKLGPVAAVWGATVEIVRSRWRRIKRAAGRSFVRQDSTR